MASPWMITFSGEPDSAAIVTLGAVIQSVPVKVYVPSRRRMVLFPAMLFAYSRASSSSAVLLTVIVSERAGDISRTIHPKSTENRAFVVTVGWSPASWVFSVTLPRRWIYGYLGLCPFSKAFAKSQQIRAKLTTSSVPTIPLPLRREQGRCIKRSGAGRLPDAVWALYPRLAAQGLP